jgi:hypothetical protein
MCGIGNKHYLIVFAPATDGFPVVRHTVMLQEFIVIKVITLTDDLAYAATFI